MPTSRRPSSSASAPKIGWVTEEAIQYTATITASSVGSAWKRSCSVGSRAPRMAVMASLTVCTRARKTARPVPARIPWRRRTCGIGAVLVGGQWWCMAGAACAWCSWEAVGAALRSSPCEMRARTRPARVISPPIQLTDVRPSPPSMAQPPR
jgi:hypothetical protein